MSAAASVLSTIPVARPYIGEEEEGAVIDVLRSGWITQGPRVAEFEKRFCEYVGCDNAVAVSSCTTALHLAMIACGIQPGDEVICPSLSFIATANAIAYVGATPVFGDIDPDTYNLSAESVESLITAKTKAILVVHQIGLPAEMNALLAIAAKHNLIVIEDAACAIGSLYDGELIGKPLGTVACFSFHPRKILTTGEGGMITTNDPELAERLRRLRQHAMSMSDMARHNSSKVTVETYDEVGFNFRMTDMQAAIGMVQLDRLPEMLERRRYLAARYYEGLQDIQALQLPVVPDNCVHNFQSYMVRILGPAASNRDAIMQALLEKGISTRRAIMAIHRERPYQNTKAILPVTDCVTDTGMILPLFYQITESQQDQVIDAIQGLGL
jgi:dTDP-4-amino-4,6-dideoxygalactose transaminase